MATLPPSLPPAAPAATPRRRRWVLIGVAALVLALAFWSAINPFGDKGYVAISHGDHVHYVPEDRDPEASISNFPTTPPGPDERILPDGRVVPR
ncbi:MAG: hypothetical protein AAGI91_15530 [Bacteroidota bacterium]